MNLVIVADVWHTMPFVALILQAALATLPEELDEAAAVDGANAWQRFWQHPPAAAAPGHPGGADRPHRGCLPRVRHRLHHHQRRAGVSRPSPSPTLTYLNSFSYGKQGTGAALSFLISVFTIAMAFIYIRFLYRPEETQ